MILGNYGMSLQLIDGMPLSAAVMAGEPTEAVAMTILETLPLSKLVMLVVALVVVGGSKAIFSLISRYYL